MVPPPGGKLHLPSVTLCSAASVNVAATLRALTASLDQIEVAECILFTHEMPHCTDDRIKVELIEPITSSVGYSNFMLRQLPKLIDTDHALVCQWDGFVVDAAGWNDDYLSYDYIGSVWPQFDDGRSVGNGGFSLRSRKLLQGCLDPDFVVEHPEDVAICRTNRELLENTHRCVFADIRLASKFAFERRPPAGRTFGFHGVFNLVPVLGARRAFEIIKSLDNRAAVWRDFWTLLRQLGSGSGGIARQVAFATDGFRARFRR